jgi:hypothetical protein
VPLRGNASDVVSLKRCTVVVDPFLRVSLHVSSSESGLDAIRVGCVVAIAVRIVFLDVVEPAFSILSPRAQELGDFEWIVVSAESRVLRRFHLLRVVAIVVRRVGRVSPHVCLRSWSPEGLVRLVVRVVLLEITVVVCKSWRWSSCMTVV